MIDECNVRWNNAGKNIMTVLFKDELNSPIFPIRLQSFPALKFLGVPQMLELKIAPAKSPKRP